MSSLQRPTHTPQQCKFKSATCYKCNRQGHIAKACLSKTAPARQPGLSHHQGRQHYVDLYNSYSHDEGQAQPSAGAEFHLFSMSAPTHSPINVPLLINGKSVNFQLDTGATLTVITQDDCNKVTTGDISVQQYAKQLQTYTGESVPVVRV